METKGLPLGTFVYLENGTKKIMIIGRGIVTADEEEERDVFYDYIGCGYPEGVDPNDAIFFNDEDIDEIIYTGYTDGEDVRFLKVYENCIDGFTAKKKDM